MHDGAASEQVVGIVFPMVDIAPGAVRAPCPRNLPLQQLGAPRIYVNLQCMETEW